VDLVGAQHMAADGLRQRRQQPRSLADPVGQGRALQHHAFAGLDLALAVQRQAVGVLAPQDVGQQARSGQAAFDRAARHGSLRDRLAAGAGQPGADMAHDAEAAGLVVQDLRHILADLAQRASAGLAVAAAINTRRWVVRDRAARQMRGQFAQSGTRLGCALLAGRLDAWGFAGCNATLPSTRGPALSQTKIQLP
jgi:hypothetical protein